MQSIANTSSYVVVALVALVLLAGLRNMLKSGSASMSQTLMRWRVGLQFVAICILMLALYLKQS
jgi:hypothetical protein